MQRSRQVSAGAKARRPCCAGRDPRAARVRSGDGDTVHLHRHPAHAAAHVGGVDIQRRCPVRDLAGEERAGYTQRRRRGVHQGHVDVADRNIVVVPVVRRGGVDAERAAADVLPDPRAASAATRPHRVTGVRARPHWIGVVRRAAVPYVGGRVVAVAVAAGVSRPDIPAKATRVEVGAGRRPELGCPVARTGAVFRRVKDDPLAPASWVRDRAGLPVLEPHTVVPADVQVWGRVDVRARVALDHPVATVGEGLRGSQTQNRDRQHWNGKQETAPPASDPAPDLCRNPFHLRLLRS